VRRVLWHAARQHALRVVAESPKEFEDWLAHEGSPVTSKPELAAAGKVFFAQSCVNCHAVRGTSAKGTYGPDLTHLMSRQTLAAGVIDNDSKGENLAKWLDDPQKIKQGCLMPAFGLTGRDRDFVLDYLKSLK